MDASSTFRGITHLRRAGAYTRRSGDWPISPPVLGANSSTARTWMRLRHSCLLSGTDNFLRRRSYSAANWPRLARSGLVPGSKGCRQVGGSCLGRN
ncbi:uncharacterized protein LOC110179861 isoform X2 [Drosophila serrata]|uniref:uncharacterized protein LOC110179861 isoform X2 n=1 Tax=Drosophila serrata TaxID=7274 RepID=UPI000A1CFA1E|nr:uncharacterized protein LOC110179861 isoform X2 [Drosophila serrata]